MKRVLKIYFPILLLIILFYKKYTCCNAAFLPKIRRKYRERVEYCRLRVISDDVSAILNGNEKKTQEHLRVNYFSFKKIVELMPNKHHGWAKEYELMLFLYWMAAGCSYRVTGGFVGISRFTVKSVIHKMLEYFIQNMSHIIKPPAYEEREEIAMKFCRRSKSGMFTKAIGAIDGCHIRIKCPVKKHDEYVNYKSFYSIQCQAVVNSSHLFTDVFVGFPGSVHDTRVFKNSPLYQNATYTSGGLYLLGDSGYPCQLSPVAVITPFKNPVGRQKRFNTAHSRARNVVECAFGLLKMRWRNIFNKSLELKIENCIKTVFAACVLHNICVSGGDVGPIAEAEAVMEHVDVTVDDFNNADEADSSEAVIFRNRLMEQLI